ncbi:MAG: hypothetical protein J5I93_22765 [Pirellulaceae bacterium]|nr:hypothetical protein [Pirellulaceae bacterium]
MHTVELLEEALAISKQLGYRVRLEWLDGGGGSCEFAGQRWLFVDLSLTSNEQLERVVEVLRGDSALPGLRLSRPLARLLQIRRAA